jgi:hypothetical protein
LFLGKRWGFFVGLASCGEDKSILGTRISGYAMATTKNDAGRCQPMPPGKLWKAVKFLRESRLVDVG